MNSPNTQQPQPQQQNYAKTLTQNDNNDHRTIGYALIEALRPQDRTRAIVFFYPLSGNSMFLHKLAPAILQNNNTYKCSLLCVDRPGCGATSHLVENDHNVNNNNNQDFCTARIQCHARDVLHVLRHEGIHEVYLLGICIGHPYAIEVARQLCNDSIKKSSTNNNDNNDCSATPTEATTASPAIVKGITLVAPFVSTACGDSWWVARMGNAVPNCVLHCAVGSLVSLGTIIVPHVLKPSTIKKLMEKEEHKECEWTDADYEEMCEYALQTTSCTREAKHIEARLGASSSWQAEICDNFAIQSGYGINGIVGDDSNNKHPPVPIRIHACFKDKIATLPSVMWIAERCYGGANIVHIEQNIQSHEMMTFLGGPFRNPMLLHRIAQTWGLLENAE